MRPYVIINMAMSVDGKVSSVAREPTTFTSREDKKLLLKIRSRGDALIVGANTLATDYTTMGIPDPKLRAERKRRGQTAQPVRVIVSGQLNLSPALKVFKTPISPILIVCCQLASQSRRNKFSHLGRLIVCGKREVNIKRLLSMLTREYGIRTLVCEGGPTLNDAFFRAGSVDELCVTLCPRIVGGQKAPTLVEGIGFPYLKNAAKGKLLSCRKGKQEWFLRYRFCLQK